MAKKVYISVGHGGKDSGAVKFIVEKEYNLKIAEALAEYLKAKGVEYKMSRTTDIEIDLNDKIRDCNAYNPDLVVDIHTNAGGGKGFEVYRYSGGGTSLTLANNINAEVKKIMSSRGVKTKLGSNGKDYFAIIRDTNAPAVLLEGGFVDSKSDADFIKANYKKLAEAYAKGILKTLGVEDKPKALPVLETSGYKKGDNTIGSLALKELLLLAKKVGINKYNVDENGIIGDGTIKAINYLLGQWGYQQKGIAGAKFIKRLRAEIEKKI